MPLSADDLALWKRRLQTDRSAQALYHDRWRRAIRLFDTSYWDDFKRRNPEVVEVNYSTTFITTLVAAVFARAPRWRITAKRPGRFYQFANTMQILMEQFKDEAKLKELAIRCVVDVSTCNIAWLELGFFPSVKEPIPKPETGADQPGMLRRMNRLFRQLSGTSEPEPAQQGELHEQKRPGEFYLIRRSPWDVLIPSGHYEYERLPYLIVRERMTWGDFLENPRYVNKDRVGALSLSKVRDQFPQMRTSPYTSEAMFNPKAPASANHQDVDRPFELFTVWDRREQQVFSFSETADATHEPDEDWPYFAEGFPQRPLQFNYVPEIPDEQDNFYGFSDLDPVEPQVLEKSDLRSQEAAIRRRAPIKVFVQAGSATESSLTKMASPDIEVIPVQNVQAIQISQPIQLPPAVLQYEGLIDQDLSRDTGLPLLLSTPGQAAQIKQATTSNLVSQTTTLKTDYKVDRIELWLKEIGRYQVGLFWQFLSAEEVGERLGRLPSPSEWIPLPEDVALAKRWVRQELYLNVEAGSTRPLTQELIEASAFMKGLAIVQQVAPDLFQQAKRPLVASLIKKFHDPELEAIILATLDETAVEEAQQENRFLVAGFPQVVGRNDDHQTHDQVHAQVEQTDLVKAHRQAHLVRVQELLAARKTAGQGVRQSTASPSAAEINQEGATTRQMDLVGLSQRPEATGQRAFTESGG